MEKDGIAGIYKEISTKSGVDVKDVAKVLKTLGVENHFEEVAGHLGKTPSMADMFLGFKISQSTISV